VIQHLGTHIPSRAAAGIAEAAKRRLAELSENGEDAKWSVLFSTGISLFGFQRKGGGFVCGFACHVSGKFWVIGNPASGLLYRSGGILRRIQKT
jgi:hypothetical protein